MKQKYIKRFLVIIIGVLTLISVTSVNAWQPYNSTMLTMPVGQGNADGMLLADENDVVTTNKWNQLSIYIRNFWYITTDGMRGITGFIQGNNNIINSVGGYYVNNVNFGFGPSDFSAGINFFDASQGYGQAGNGAKGSVTYDKLNDSIVMNGFSGGLRISDSTTAHQYLLGWEKINIYGTESFDINCQYRIAGTNMLNLLTNHVEPGRLKFVTNAEGIGVGEGGLNQQPVLFEIYSNAKLIVRKGPDLASDITISKIEKLCLPSYNPNGY